MKCAAIATLSKKRTTKHKLNLKTLSFWSPKKNKTTHFTRFASHIRVVQCKQTTTKNSTVMGRYLWKHWQVGCKINKQNEMRKTTLKWTETLQIVSVLNAIWCGLNVTCHLFLSPKQLYPTNTAMVLNSHWKNQLSLQFGPFVVTLASLLQYLCLPLCLAGRWISALQCGCSHH